VFVNDIVKVVLRLIELHSKEQAKNSSIYHVGGPERLSRYDLGVKLCKVRNYDVSTLVEASQKELDLGYVFVEK
jgi:dTDP-4-dehydrorhamnose reductase